ncbi:hypothetical protein FIBSPDRAFT_1051680 [Athelia psychrophila]|uniref:Uncharacterized protein n=1 Tax=Athelia psychrophila TaxID=1759441 RepID=A0A165YQ45_9AGAM|nr:hypothetical protein FIBSPDRAFT_1051680 [Fibularhizoctonia sp. CBS 109695]
MTLSSRLFTLKRATTADIPDLNRIFTEAFSDDNDTTLQYLHEPDPRGAKYAMMKGALEHSMSKPGAWKVHGDEGVATKKRSRSRMRKRLWLASLRTKEEGRYEIEAAVDNTPEKIKHLKAIEDKENEYWDEFLCPGNEYMPIVAIAVSPAFQK